MKQPCEVSDKRMKSSTRRMKMWAKFHSLKGEQLPPLWSSLVKDAGIQNDDIGKYLAS